MAAGDRAYWSDIAALARKGYVLHGERTAASGTFTTVETIVQTLTFPGIAGQRYKITAEQSVQSTVANDVAQCRLRWATGASVTTAGTAVASKFPTCITAALGNLFVIIGYVVPATTDDVTVGVTLVRGLGTGTLSSFGSAAQVNTIHAEAV